MRGTRHGTRIRSEGSCHRIRADAGPQIRIGGGCCIHSKVTSVPQAGPARSAVGTALISAISATAAVLLVVPAFFLWETLDEIAGTAGLAPSDATWNDGDIGLGVYFGGIPAVAVLLAAGIATAAIARRYRLRTAATVAIAVAASFVISMGVSWLLVTHMPL